MSCELQKMDYVYAPVAKAENAVGYDFSWKYLYRQVLICMAPWTFYFTAGIYFGTSTVMIPQLRKEANSTVVVSDDMATWISSIHGYSAIPWSVLLPILSEIYGRKLPFNLTFIIALIGYGIWYCSTNVISILIGEIILGILIGCNMTLSVIVITEYVSPKYRILTIKSASFFWGIFVANFIGTYFHWRNIIIVALFCLMYNVTSFFWPQSPHWLASKGRFEECARSHRMLKGTSDEAENELQKLIISQKNYLRHDPSPSTVLSYKKLRHFIKILSYKVVYKPILLCSTLLIMYNVSGKLVCNVYAIQILMKITGKESTAYKGMLILDGISLIGMYFGCYLAKVLKRRTMLFSTTSCSVLFLLLLSLYLFLIKLNYILENSTVSLTLLTIFSISVSCGPMLLATSLFGELIPLQYKGSALILIVMVENIAMSTILKIAPLIFKSFGIHTAFLFYGIGVLVCLIILYFYLPETKDKTLTEIEEHFTK